MIALRTGLPQDVPRQRELWQLAFGDSDDYLDYVYAHQDLAEIVVLLDDDLIQSMTFLYPMTVALPDGTTATSAYIYALATHPDARGKGYAGMLLQYVDFILAERGIDCVTTVPAMPSLHQFFESNGFQPGFSTQKLDISREILPPPGPEDTIVPIEGAQYQALRTQLLAGSFHIDYPTAMLDYQAGVSQMFSGNLYRMEVDGIPGVCVAERHSPHLVVTKECLLPPAQMAKGVALLAQVLPAQQYHLRAPWGWTGMEGSRDEEFGMIKWYNATLSEKYGTLRQGYLGLAFD